MDPLPPKALLHSTAPDPTCGLQLPISSTPCSATVSVLKNEHNAGIPYVMRLVAGGKYYSNRATGRDGEQFLGELLDSIYIRRFCLAQSCLPSRTKPSQLTTLLFNGRWYLTAGEGAAAAGLSVQYRQGSDLLGMRNAALCQAHLPI